MTKLIEEKVSVIHGDWDYAPFVIYSSIKGKLLEGDNIHKVGYEYFAEGYSEASGAKVNDVYIDTQEDLEKHKSILKELNLYQEFADVIID